MSDTESVTDKSSTVFDDEERDTDMLETMIRSKPMYYILAQYLETEQGKNIADVLQDLVKAVKSLEITIKNTSSTPVETPVQKE